MIRSKLLPFVLAAGLLFAANPAAQAQKGEKKEKKEKEYKEKGPKEHKKGRHKKDGAYEDRRTRGTVGDILGRVILPPAGSASPRQLQGVPKGHYPPPGQCRIWYPNRPPGHQPPPTSCDNLRGVRLERGAFVLHGDRAYDADYDWQEEERRRPGSVGRDILDILFPR